MKPARIGIVMACATLLGAALFHSVGGVSIQQLSAHVVTAAPAGAHRAPGGCGTR